jgi:hypothetical protein
MSLVQNNSGEFRTYTWDSGDGSEPITLLSVTSIRSLCGENFRLVNWKMANLADAAHGTQKRTVVGPRGGVKDVRQVWEYPSEFVKRYLATEGDQSKVDDLRKWVRAQADAPRNVAASRGTMTHEVIERNIEWDRIERAYVENAFENLSRRDRQRLARAVSDEDVFFVRNSARQYADLRDNIPMVELAKEVRVVNLTAGYAGTFDALVWVLGRFEGDQFYPLGFKQQAEARALKAPTQGDVARIGGFIVMVDWKTGADIHTDNVLQAHAYMAAEFAVIGGQRDDRITQLLRASGHGAIGHIRPNKWRLHLFPFDGEDALLAFFGSVVMARFLARYPEPEPIYTFTFAGESEEDDS